jgi:rhodanese-related sulfurtransferase
LLISFFALQLLSCQDTATAAGGGTNKKVSVDEFQQKLSATPGAQLVDVRTPEEYAGGHLQNAQNIDFRSSDFADKMSKLDKSKPVFVYCLSGGRSTNAANQLADMGFKEIYNMDGGIMKWRSAGKPLDPGTVKKKGMTMDEFNHVVSAGDKYFLVDYNAKWCEPCRKMFPMLQSFCEQKKDKVVMVSIDADENKDLLTRKNIASIPYLELYKDGKLVWKHDGAIEEAQFLKETGL